MIVKIEKVRGKDTIGVSQRTLVDRRLKALRIASELIADRRIGIKVGSVIYTIGHGRHPFDYFLELLQKHEIEFVCDVRAFARSRWPQFNGLVLAELLRENGIGYEHIPETGGKNKPKPDDLEWGVNRIVEIASERSEEHTSELQSPCNLVCRLLLE